MKIENGVLKWNDVDGDELLLERSLSYIDDVMLNASVLLSRQDAADLARYLRHFAETGKLEEPLVFDDGKCKPKSPRCEIPPFVPKSQCAECHKCKRPSEKCDGAAEHCFVTIPEVGEKMVSDQQLAREKFNFWRAAILATVQNSGLSVLSPSRQASNADELVEQWVKRREKFGVK